MLASRSFRLGRERGQAIEVAGRRVVPVAFVVSLHARWRNRAGGGFAWVHPLGVEVQEGSRTRFVAIPDLALLGRFGVGLLGILVARAFIRSAGKR